FIDLAIPEIRVICDEEKNQITALSSKIQRPSEYIVEECMLAANSAVGSFLAERPVPGLFRIHEEPSEEKLLEFSDTAMTLFGIQSGDLSTRTLVRRFLASLPDDPRKPVVENLFLRSLPRAAYSAEAHLHYGLGKMRYCHFTSPIRRYTDLAVHQQLWNFDCNRRLKPTSSMANLALEMSEKEQNNDNAYYAANDRLKLRYLSELMEHGGKDKLYRAVVSKINSYGILAEVPELGIMGMIRAEREGTVFRHRRNSEKLTRDRSAAEALAPGRFLYVKLDDIDFSRGQVLLQKAEDHRG
ncbi:MAG: RNB domain-containing ribonuclease, partial [Victivallaceae bacterium]|nr:RNB domain-containing ribonuclease [Victivallaceae bacterium]